MSAANDRRFPATPGVPMPTWFRDRVHALQAAARADKTSQTGASK